MKTLNLDLGDRSYPIIIGAGLLGQSELLAQHICGPQVMVVTNETIAPLYLDKVLHSLSDFQTFTKVLPDGEQHKNLTVLGTIFDALLEVPCDRSVTLVALGGGVIGDITGFAAACYQRGVPYIQVPTTLLAQVDSAIGGKTGVNHPLGKNMIGAFYQPQCVLTDNDTLDTLDNQQLSAGVAEIIKYSLIRDIGFFEWLEQNMEALLARESAVLAHAIKRSCRNKVEVVAADEKESGMRAILNLGHTFGHAIETGTGYGKWLHGEAVAVGMYMAADLSHRLGWLPLEALQHIESVISGARLPIRGPAELDPTRFLELMTVDKKVKAGKLHLVLLKAIGQAIVTRDFNPELLQETIIHCKAAA